MSSAPLNKTNLIINYLPQNFSDADFHELFSTAGIVTASKIIRDRATGYSYGFGFIDYGTEEEASNAIDTLNGYQLQHKKIKVSYARQGENVKGANLYLRHLPKELTEHDLEDMFRHYGDIVQARVLVDNVGESRGVGFVLFSTKEQAQRALQDMDGMQPAGFSQPLSVKFAEDNKLKMRPNPMAPVSATNIPIGYSGGALNLGRMYGGMNGGVGGAYGGGGMNFGDGGGVGPMRSNQIRARFNPMNGNGGVMSMMNQGAAGGGMMPQASGFVLFVFNIGTDTDEFALWQMFSPFGTVQKVSVVRDFQKKQGKGYGFVTMVNYGEAVGAIQGLNGQEFGGNRLQVSFKN